jgi:hypothetical protein
VLAETSVFLAVHGFYEQACATLRMQLDGFLIRLYWDTLDKMEELESHPKVIRINSDYWEWESGKADDYPKSKEVWQTLSENENFNAFDKRYMLKEEISNQTQLLHKFIHGRPPTRHYPGATSITAQSWARAGQVGSTLTCDGSNKQRDYVSGNS